MGVKTRRYYTIPRQQEEDIGEEDMANKPEYYLDSLLRYAFKGKGFKEIKTMIQENYKYVPQKCKRQLLNQLDKAVKMELDKNEFLNVALLLKGIQVYCRSDFPEGINLLLQQRLIPKMVTWFVRTKEFLTLIESKENKDLENLLEVFFTTALMIGKNSAEGRKQLFDFFLQHLGHLATESNVNFFFRQEALKTLNTLLANVSCNEKKVFVASEEICLLMKELAKGIQDVGALFRMMLKKCRNEMMVSWFEDQHITKIFRRIKDEEFETDSRNFLNELNEGLGDKRGIYSIPCKAAYAELIELKKPSDDKLKEFWIDFNCGSESITFYSESLEDTLWESIRLLKEDITNYCLQVVEREKILKITMSKSVVINKAEITNIRIHFDSCFDVLTPLLKAIGKNKMIILDEEENAYQGQTATASTNFSLSNTQVSIQSERKDDLERNSLLDILTSYQSNKSVNPVIKKIIPAATVVDGEKESQQLKNNDGFQASSSRILVYPSCSGNTLAAPPSAQMLKSSLLQPKDKADEPDVERETDIYLRKILPLKEDTLGKEKEARSPSEQMVEEKRDEEEDDFSSGPSTHDMVLKMKRKQFVRKNTLHQSLEMGNRKLKMLERSLPSNYKTHLFSESNSDSLSNVSEKSWIYNFQSNTLPKVVDYTRKKPKIKSKLKVLPLSSPSSGSDYDAKKVENSTVPWDKIQRRTQPESEMHYSANHYPVPVCSTPNLNTRQNGLEMMDATFPLSSGYLSCPSDDKTSKKDEAAANTVLFEDKIPNSKRTFSEWSADFNRKRSKQTLDNELSFAFEPRKLFSSIEIADGTPKDRSLNDFENEEFGDTEVFAAFGNFSRELKKRFWVRLKKMALCSHEVVNATGQNLSALFDRIYQRRLYELEIFHKSVVKELSSLENKTMFLSSLENETLEFWTKQSNKLNSKLNAFCIHQIQRLESMDVQQEDAKGLDGTIHNENDRNATDHMGEQSKTSVGPAN
ncbi:synaptonemal complex protein 2-like isoform X2 [Erythrolamprus reginae]|uniref:synaptonemal complex protein 2-like isoform X2 n=2 Tax=Erythrolamprus reginae TaxID=121349 RepID=UPI00396D0590